MGNVMLIFTRYDVRERAVKRASSDILYVRHVADFCRVALNSVSHKVGRPVLM
jgi:hypothetical protein